MKMTILYGNVQCIMIVINILFETRYVQPSRQDTLIQHCFIAGPAFETLAQQ